MTWQIVYYSKRVYQDIASLPETLLGSFLAYTKIMEDHGPNLGMPHTRPMGNGLFEIRASGKEGIARIFYCTLKGDQIWILHSFVKKTQQTPKSELQIAKKRLKEVKEYD